MAVVNVVSPARIFSASETALNRPVGIVHLAADLFRLAEPRPWEAHRMCLTVCGKRLRYRWATGQAARPCQLCEGSSTREPLPTAAWISGPEFVSIIEGGTGIPLKLPPPSIAVGTGAARGCREGTVPATRPG